MSKNILIVTGLSGSGKSLALHALEDQGYIAVDNLPVPLLKDLVKLEFNGLKSGLAVGIDGRSRVDLASLPQVVAELRQSGYSVRTFFLEAADEVLLTRYSLTRRRHPCSNHNTLSECIILEKEILTPLREMADAVVDTTFFSPSDLQNRIKAMVADGIMQLGVLITSFGFKYGTPRDADFTFDTRFLVNPFYDATLRPYSGLESTVAEYIYEKPLTQTFLNDLLRMLSDLLPSYKQSGKNQVHLAIGCTGGRHRSVFVAQWIGQKLGELEGLSVAVRHRDIGRGASH